MSVLDHSTVLITGASSGLGAEFARQLAPRAKCIILAARRLDRLQALASEIAGPNLTVHCLAADLSREDDTQRFLTELAGLGRKIDVLINNAGLGDHGPFEKSDWSRVHAMVEVNVRALTQVTHAVLGDLILGGRGAIVNVSSIAS